MRAPRKNMLRLTPDVVNGGFELAGGILYWFSVRRLIQDKEVKGFAWPVQIFFAIWGLWNMYFYTNLNQWWSFYGGILLAWGNITWTCLAAYYHFSSKLDGKVEELR